MDTEDFLLVDTADSCKIKNVNDDLIITFGDLKYPNYENIRNKRILLLNAKHILYRQYKYTISLTSHTKRNIKKNKTTNSLKCCII